MGKLLATLMMLMLLPDRLHAVNTPSRAVAERLEKAEIKSGGKVVNKLGHPAVTWITKCAMEYCAPEINKKGYKTDKEFEDIVKELKKYYRYRGGLKFNTYVTETMKDWTARFTVGGQEGFKLVKRNARMEDCYDLLGWVSTICSI